MNPLKALLNKAIRPAQLRVEQSADEATVYLYDYIGEWLGGLSAKDIVAQINNLSAPVIHLRINSPGGDVFDARAIATAVAAHPSRIVAHVDGIAASAASWIAVAASEVEITQGAFLMVHNSWGMTAGDKTAHAEAAQVLEKLDNAIVHDYARKCKTKNDEEIKAWMDAETWFTADEALANGLVDRVVDGKPNANSSWNIAGCYRNAPASLRAPQDAPQSGADDVECAVRRRRAEALQGIA